MVILRRPWECATFGHRAYRMHEYVLAFGGCRVGRQPFHIDVHTAVAMSPTMGDSYPSGAGAK
jgi:hypothetical protein